MIAGNARRFSSCALFAAAVCGLGIAVVGCNDGAGEVVTPLRPTFAAELRLLDATGQARVAFRPGEPITLELRVTNLTSEEQTTQHPSAQIYDFAVQGPSGDSIWRWSRDKEFATVVTELHFAPNETRKFTEVWDQTDDAGKPVAPGAYTASGESGVSDIEHFRIE